MKYNPQLVQEIRTWIEENGLIEHGGATFKSLLDAFKVDQRTWYRWMERADFAEAITKAKQVFKGSLEKRLVDSLARAAQGYEGTFERTEYVSNAEGKPMISKKIVEKKPVAPSVAANIFLLTNLAPDRWKNRQNQEVTGADGEPLSQAPIQITISEAKPSKVEVEKP